MKLAKILSLDMRPKKYAFLHKSWQSSNYIINIYSHFRFRVIA